MTSRFRSFTVVELERMLDWYKALPLCHDVLPRDDDLADKIRLALIHSQTRHLPNP